MYARTFRKCTPVQDVAGDGDGVEAGGEKRHKREESALNITELRSNDDDIQGRGAWSFRPPAYNAVRGMSGLCGFAGRSA